MYTYHLNASLSRLFKQAITYTVLVAMQLGTLVQTKEAYAQYVNYGGQPTNGQVNGQPNTGYVAPTSGATSGYTPDGILFMGGQRIGNPHQVLHDAQIPAFMTITATRFTYSNINDPLAPNYGQGTLLQMAQATTAGSDASVLLNRLYLSPTNPYPVVPLGTHNNYQTYQGVLQNAQQANFLLTNADDGKTYAFKTLTAASAQAADLLIRELPNTQQFRDKADPNGGGVGVRVTQNGDAVALRGYLATVKPYDYTWQPNYGNTFGNPSGTGSNPGAGNYNPDDYGQAGQSNPGFQGQFQGQYSGWANSNNFVPTYEEGGAPAQNFQAFIKQLQDDAVKNNKRVTSQTAANSLDLSGVNPNSLFGEGYDLFQYGSNPNRELENDFLRKLQAGQLTAGTDAYNEASRIAQERYRIAYSIRLETVKPQVYAVAGSASDSEGVAPPRMWFRSVYGRQTALPPTNPAAGQPVNTPIGTSPAGAAIIAGKPGGGTFYVPGEVAGTGTIVLDPTERPEDVDPAIAHEDVHHEQNKAGRFNITRRPGETSEEFAKRYIEERLALEAEAVLAQGSISSASVYEKYRGIILAYLNGHITKEEAEELIRQSIGEDTISTLGATLTYLQYYATSVFQIILTWILQNPDRLTGEPSSSSQPETGTPSHVVTGPTSSEGLSFGTDGENP